MNLNDDIIDILTKHKTEIDMILNQHKNQKHYHKELKKTLDNEKKLIIELNQTIDNKQDIITQLNKEKEKLSSELDVMKHSLEKAIKETNEKNEEVKKANTLITTIISDLAIIKESKSWLYTKPLRELKKILTGMNHE